MADIRRLRYFVAVASEQSFTRAAARLNIAQPPLSRRIQEIEEELGTKLIERSSRPLTLTPAGQLFYAHALQVLERHDTMERAMERFIKAERPRFTLGVQPSEFYVRLPQIVRRFRTQDPGTDLVLTEMSSSEQIAALKEGRIDAGLGRVRIDDPAIEREVLREERLVAALPPGAGPANEPIGLDHLARMPLLLYPREPRPSHADVVLSVFRDSGLNPEEVIEVRELETALIMVSAGVGACLIPASSQWLAHPEVICRPVQPRAVSPIILYHRPGEASPQFATLLRTFASLFQEWGYPLSARLLQA
ncbi:LysR family transcriptional regulator [Novosphingobium mangrovi (ex Hu et al. 2023)]|uniref:LysR family transcriptional regulator n=1 Tax=Novosphingobium mangrovi (ex Hu et al. 2023) TaxID=2930094 RepID=A0ABT0ABL5_9SPHN|nr:LysR family transcriptional regulator [Novosphingobium mangrovi (ex Hu et al. 2023)]MCJ1960554.1 LysR family transcriptional regulator [Novosphingobium mangrovi (ex Hu et al. 2023)]